VAHAEAVLLVDDREPELRNPHLLFEQGMGAGDQQRLAGLEPRGDAAPLRRRGGAGQHLDRRPDRCGEALERAGVLARQDLGRRHEGGLEAALDRVQRAQEPDHGLPAADVAHQHAVHRGLAAHVGDDLAECGFLIRGQRPGQRPDRPRRQPALPCRDQPASRLAQGAAPQCQHGLQQEQLLEGEAATGALARRVVVGEVDLAQRLGERRQAGVRHHLAGERVADAIRGGVERQAHGEPHRARGEPARQRVHRHQAAGVEQRLDLALQHLEQRVQHATLERIELAAHHHRHAGPQGAGEERLAEEVAMEAAAAVLDQRGEIGAADPGAQQGAAAPPSDDRDQLVGRQLADAHEAPRVEPGARHVAHQLLEGGEPEALEQLRAARADARQVLEPRRGLERRRRRAARRGDRVHGAGLMPAV
jgi:hypothetical protein